MRINLRPLLCNFVWKIVNFLWNLTLSYNLNSRKISKLSPLWNLEIRDLQLGWHSRVDSKLTSKQGKIKWLNPRITPLRMVYQGEKQRTERAGLKLNFVFFFSSPKLTYINHKQYQSAFLKSISFGTQILFNTTIIKVLNRELIEICTIDARLSEHGCISKEGWPIRTCTNQVYIQLWSLLYCFHTPGTPRCIWLGSTGTSHVASVYAHAEATTLCRPSIDHRWSLAIALAFQSLRIFKSCFIYYFFFLKIIGAATAVHLPTPLTLLQFVIIHALCKHLDWT